MSAAVTEPAVPAPETAATRFGGPAVIALAFIFMLAWTWAKWPDPLVDFGRELYLAWQVSEGKVLYRDVEHFNGPLSVSINAALFRVFGPGIHTLVWANIAVAVGVTAMLYALLRRAFDSVAATMAGLAFVTLFMCVQFVDTGNYNFITPYSHEVTHGVALSLAAMLLIARFAATQRRRFVVTAGVGLGLLWLTKFEIFLAGFGAVMVGVVTTRSPVATLRRVTLLLVPALGLAGCTFVLLCWKLGIASGLRGVLGSAYYVFDPELSANPFYQRVMGLDDVPGNLLACVISGLVLVGLLVLRSLAGSRGRHPMNTTPAMGLALLLPPVVALLLWSAAPWHLLFRGLPLMLAVWLIVTIRQMRRGDDAARAALPWAVFSLLLLPKIGLATSVQHYGFALAMPGVVGFVALLTGGRTRLLPAVPGERSGFARISRAFGVSLVLTLIAVHLSFYSARFADKPIEIGTGRNRFLAGVGAADQPSRGQSLAAILPMIDRLAAKDATLAVVPEGAMINFLAGRRNPTPFVTLQPPEFVMFGGERITSAYQASPPDFVVINLMVDPGEYGSKGFDQDYGRSLADWIKANYRQVFTAGRLILMQRK